MKAHLMFRDKDFEISKEETVEQTALKTDLELEYLLEKMTQEDKIIQATSKEVLLNPLLSKEEISYRQQNLSDALENKDAIRALYDITIQTEQKRKESWAWFSSSNLLSALSSSVQLLDIYIEMLHKLRLVADEHLDHFHSDGFRNLFLLLQKELSDEYFEMASAQLEDLGEVDGTLISSKVGNDLHGTPYVLREKEKGKGERLKWFFTPSYSLASRDDRGAKDFEHRKKRAKNEPANVLAQAADNLDSFFSMLRKELAFYVGCINLSESIEELDMPISMSNILTEDSHDRSWRGLYDISLLLTTKSKVIGNEMQAKNKLLYIITGANQGGKTTFLRSLGQAQLMAQAGMFVCAEEFTVPIRDGIFTHFAREEDDTLTSGKLDEELVRMSETVDQLNKNSLVLFNESFASTNEREGSEINNQVTKALIESGVEVFSVTHLYTYAYSFLEEKLAHFSRAERLEDGQRTFKILEGEPLTTAFGEDLYHQIFDDEDQ